MRKTLVIAAVVLFILVGSNLISREAAPPVQQASLVAGAPIAAPSADSANTLPRGWPMLGLSVIIITGGLVLMRRIAGTIS